MTSTATPTPVQQTLTITVTANAGIDRNELSRVVWNVSGVVDATVEGSGAPGGPDRERLIDLLEWVGGEHAKRQLGLPSEWYQGDWFTRRDTGPECGTACCIAGKVALDDGGVPVFEKWDEAADEYVEVPWNKVERGRATGRVRFQDGSTVSASEYAQRALGLTDQQAQELFAGNNTFESLVKQVGRLLTPTREGSRRPRRVLRPGRNSCDEGESCDICYEDVTDEDDVPF